MHKYISIVFISLVVQATSWGSPALLEDEKNTVQIVKDNVLSVAHVSSLKLVQKSLFDFDPVAVPAGTGTGFVWDNDSHIVTNFHVVQGSSQALVTFNGDKTEYKARVIGTDPAKDIAVLKVEGLNNKNVRPVRLGTSKDLEVGQKTIAIGNPFGLDHTVTTGIVSALGRKMEGIGGVTINGVIQTDASINPGNSGGPLLNSAGEVIGINTMIISNSGASAGIGFAVPIDEALRAVPDLIQYGKIMRPILGIETIPPRYQYYFDNVQGLVIKNVDRGSPAHKAGLKGLQQDNRGRIYLGDVIVEMDGHKINNYDDYFQVMDKKKYDDTLMLKVRHDGQVRDVTVRLFQY